MVRFNLLGTLCSAMKRQRREDGVALMQILMALLVWPVLKLPSIHCFCCELCQYLRRNDQRLSRPEDLIYDFWGREDINWRKWACGVSRRVSEDIRLGNRAKLAFVVDDSVKRRRGRNVEGTSRHYDHNQGITVPGHQLLELGLAGEHGFLPVDRQIFTGDCAAVHKNPRREFRDKRSAAARDMARAREEGKPTMLARMLKEAIKAGHRAAWLIGDAWFGSKANIALALEHGLHALFQMKRGKLRYRVGARLYSAAELHAKFARKMRQTSPKARFKTIRIEAEINLESKPNAEPVWQPVALILSAPAAQEHDSWVIFLTTNLDASVERILEVYALRWSIEVYFKEAKQSFGLLSEQSGKYEVAYASVHLAAVRYMIVFEAMQRNGNLSFGEVRDLQSGKLLALSFASLLWQLFRSIISGVFEQFQATVGVEPLQVIAAAIDGAVEDFLANALQITPSHVRALREAEAIGVL